MMPKRLILFLIGCVILALFVLANPEETDLYLLFWSGRFSKSEIVVGSVLAGAILALLIRSHIASLLKDKDSFRVEAGQRPVRKQGFFFRR